MLEPSYFLHPALPEHAGEIELLLDRAFGLGRQTKTSYRLREGEEAVEGLSLIAISADGSIVGTISYWPLVIGEPASAALLLGPLAIDPSLQGKGIGRALMRHTLAVAREQGHALVILVGDAPYYARVGFAPVDDGRLIMPGYVAPGRLLYIDLQPGALAGCQGLVLGRNRAETLGKPVART